MFNVDSSKEIIIIEKLSENSQNVGILNFDNEIVTESSSINIQDSSMFHVEFFSELVWI
jgi:hypothetical protein